MDRKKKRVNSSIRELIVHMYAKKRLKNLDIPRKDVVKEIVELTDVSERTFYRTKKRINAGKKGKFNMCFILLLNVSLLIFFNEQGCRPSLRERYALTRRPKDELTFTANGSTVTCADLYIKCIGKTK